MQRKATDESLTQFVEGSAVPFEEVSSPYQDSAEIVGESFRWSEFGHEQACLLIRLLPYSQSFHRLFSMQHRACMNCERYNKDTLSSLLQIRYACSLLIASALIVRLFEGPISSLSVLGTRIVIINSLEACTDLLEKRSTIYAGRPKLTFAGEM